MLLANITHSTKIFDILGKNKAGYQILGLYFHFLTFVSEGCREWRKHRNELYKCVNSVYL